MILLPLGMCPLTLEESEGLDWMMEWAIPKRTYEEALEGVRVGRTALFNELLYENFADNSGGGYGEGGWHDAPGTDIEALQQWIEARERRLLGMTLEEFVR